jgi:hypothetical protein
MSKLIEDAVQIEMAEAQGMQFDPERMVDGLRAAEESGRFVRKFTPDGARHYEASDEMLEAILGIEYDDLEVT